MVKEINKLSDVEQFMIELVDSGVNAHPDDDFTQYINTDTGEDSFTPERGEEINYLMSECFRVCENEHVDIYSFMQEIFLIKTGMDKYIPLPSQVF